MEEVDKRKKKMRRKKTMYIKLDDGVFVIDGDYITESKNIRFLYRSGYSGALPLPIDGVSNRLIRKALQFSKQRGQIKKQHNNKNDKDDNLLLQQKLHAFDHSFLQQNQAEAFDLADVACRLQMKSLFYLMRRAAAEMISQKTPEDIRKIFDVYHDENKTSARSFDYMKYMVGNNPWLFKPIM